MSLTIAEQRAQLATVYPEPTSVAVLPAITIGTGISAIRVEVDQELMERGWRWITISTTGFNSGEGEAVLDAGEAAVLLEALAAAVAAAEAAPGGVRGDPVVRTTQRLDGTVVTHRRLRPGGRWSVLSRAWVKRIPLTGYEAAGVDL